MKNSKNITAVEWLALYINGITSQNCDSIIQNAIEMEREQIIKAYNKSFELRDNPYAIAEKYYKETYGK